MDQFKIGKFISACRKEKQMTQAQLAEKLCITDKAVSKWERGIAVPDSSIMINLCENLDISVNELLRGERINVSEERQKTEELLLDMTKKEELQRKRLLKITRTTLFLGTFYYIFITVVLVTLYKKPEVMESPFFWLSIILTSMGSLCFALAIIITGFTAGHFVCKNCQHEFECDADTTPFIAMIGKPKKQEYYLKCPKCGKKTWVKRILPK